MQPLRVLLLGVGNFGASWAQEVLPFCDDICFAAAVDAKPERFAFLPDGIAHYTDLDEALDAVRPDLVLNVTPPHAHAALNRHLLNQGYPVLCEKPAAASTQEAHEMLRFYRECGGFLMIAENYRYSPVMRACREVIASGKLGKVLSAQCHFRHYHPDAAQFYHGKLDQPLLLDVTVHHLDVARYLTGAEPERTRCETWSAPYSWYGERPANAHIRTWMTGGVFFSYYGTLAAYAGSTDWNGDWEIECERGTLRIQQSRLTLYCDHEGESVLLPGEGGESAQSRLIMLREAARALHERRCGETDLTDNIRSYLWLQDAIRSSTTHEEIASSAI